MADNASKTKKVRVKVPYDRWDENDKFVGVNGEVFQLKRGEYVEVPDYVAEVLENGEKEDMKLVEKINKIKSSGKTNK